MLMVETPHGKVQTFPQAAVVNYIPTSTPSPSVSAPGLPLIYNESYSYQCKSTGPSPLTNGFDRVLTREPQRNRSEDNHLGRSANLSQAPTMPSPFRYTTYSALAGWNSHSLARSC